MNYEEFKETVKKHFLDCMPNGYQNMKVTVITVDKINRKMDVLSLSVPKEENSRFSHLMNEKTMISPTLYINDMYDEYVKTGNFRTTLQEAAEAMDKAFREARIPSLDISRAKDRIVFQLVNTMQNEDLLENTPHRNFQDLSIIYRWVIDNDERGLLSFIIHNHMAELLEMTEEQLFKAAAENTRRMLPPMVQSIKEIMKDLFMAQGLSVELADQMIEESDPKRNMWVISNERKINGAVSMLYEDKLHSLAESVGTDLYILPSSIHEVIAVSTETGRPEELAQMVSETNRHEVMPGERLSNQVYHYSRNMRTITSVANTGHRIMDGL